MTERTGRVLVVDDSEDDHLQIRRLLRDEFHVAPVYTGSEALERLQHETFDALITDQKMPRMSGASLIEHIKEDERLASLRCVLLSGKTDDQQLVEILRSGRIYHYFEKNKTLLTPEGRGDLLQAVRNAVQASRLEREGGRLTQRLRAQNEALTAQYRLLRTLVSIKDPAAALRLVVQSLAQRLQCRAVVAVVDLQPSHGAMGHFAQRTDARPMREVDVRAWNAWTAEAYGTLSGRPVPGDHVFGHTPEILPTEGAVAPHPNDIAPTMPVFVNRDLRGLIVVVRDPKAPLEEDEADLFSVWRDQLQDALTRIVTQMLDEHRRIELMVETMTEGVVLTDEEGAVTLMNPAARRLLGIQEFDRPDFSVVVSAMGLSSLDVLRQLGVGDTKIAWREIRLDDAWFQVLLSHVRDHSGASVGILTVIRDVTEQKLSEQRREEFVHIIGHELRSPLTSIGGVMDLLSKQVLGELNPRQREYVDMAKDSCVKINHILNDLLDLAKFEKGRMPLALMPVNLEQVVGETARRFEALALEKGVNLSFECLLEGLYCQADPDRLGQVMSNLLSNAFKFTPADGHVRVSVFSTFSAPELYLVSVNNDGEEIAERDLDRIFDKYEQAAVTDRRSVGGTGLGLSICRSIIRGHGGEIWVESGRGEGTTFVFSLPSAPAHAAERESTGESPSGPTNADGQPVLLVCPDEQEALALKALLLAMDFAVRVCRPVVELVRAQVVASAPALAVYLDIEGHPLDEVLAELASHNDLPVVAMLPTGSPAPRAVDLVIEVPPDAIVLASMLNVVLARQRQRRRMRVLVVDRDAAWWGTVAEHLDAAGYLPYGAATAELALRRIESLLPDLVILDLGLEGAEAVLARVRGQAGAAIPTLYTHIDEAGAWSESPESYAVAAGTDPRALLVQVRTRLAEDRRRGVDTLIVLPGGRELQREVQARMRDREPYAYCAIDIEGLRDAIDQCGFMWGHGAMSHVAELVHRMLREHADERAFLGHQRDDDFVFLVGPDHCERVCSESIRAFERLGPVITSGHDGGDGVHLSLSITAIVDGDGRFDRFAALQADLSRARQRDTGEVVLIVRH